jgi:peptide deformylase
MGVVDEVVPTPTEAEYERLLREIKKLRDAGKIPKMPTFVERVSWAYGNVALSNPNVTRETVERAARKLDEERSISIGRPMRRSILIWPDQELLHPSVPVSVEEMGTPEFKALVNDMFETMRDAGGVGLAAVQIGVHKRLFVMETSGSSPYVFINPSIVGALPGRHEVEESCLSLPGIVERVLRSPEVVVEGQVHDGSTWTGTFRGLEAQCVQHEIEHLDGHTLADGFGLAKRDAARRKIRKTLQLRGRR